MDEPNQFLVLLLIFTACFIGLVPLAAGLSVAASATIGGACTGALTALLGRRFGTTVTIPATALLVLSGFGGAYVTVKAFPNVDAVLVGMAVITVEIVLGIGCYAVYQHLDDMAQAAGRRRLAHRLKWEYEPEGTVPVPGPRTAVRLRSVPNGATSTTGRNILHADMDGLAVTVFDRSGPRGFSRTIVQTTWLLRLPLALPFVHSSFLHHDDGFPASTDDPDFTRTLMTPSVRRTAMSPGFPPVWWIEGDYLCLTHDNKVPRGAAPELVMKYVGQLADLASRFPWQDLGGYAAQRPR